MRRCVLSRNLKNEEAMARVGPQSHGGGGGKKNIWALFVKKLIKRDLEHLIFGKKKPGPYFLYP